MSENNILTFENIMEAKDITEETVPVPKWGGSVKVRSISYRNMGKIKAAVAAAQGKDEVSDDDIEVEKAILVEGLIEPKISPEQADLLMEKSANSVVKVLTAIMGSSDGEEDSVKEEEKNFRSEPGEVLPVQPSGGDASDGAGTSDGSETPTE